MVKDNPPAFPTPEDIRDDYGYRTMHHPGMSLRDWFAGQALVGLLSTCLPDDKIRIDVVAGYAYWTADAMLVARSAAEGE